MGAAGIQVGSLFSLTKESGCPPKATRRIIRAIHSDDATVESDGRVSSTGFPFKVVHLDDTLADPEVRERRERICDLGYLREPYVDERGWLMGRCPTEPADDYVRKGGDPDKAEGRACLCNALCANIGLPQGRSWGTEPELFTAGDAVESLPLGPLENPHYTAEDVIQYLYGDKPPLGEAMRDASIAPA